MNYSSYAIVTGGSSGIGLECTRALASALPQALVVVASRTSPDHLPSNTQFRHLDLASLESIDEFVQWWPYGPVSSLTCCAGVINWNLTFTPSGLEDTFAINHVGHAALLMRLVKRNLIASRARITFVSSSLHRADNKSGHHPFWTNTDDVAHARAPEQKLGRTPYANSKLANVAFANALARRVERAGGDWSVNTYDPGFVPGSGLARSAPLPLRLASTWVLPYFTWAFQRMGVKTSTAQRSGKVLAEMAYSAEYDDLRGGFIHIDEQVRSSDQSHDVSFQDELWDWTMSYLKIDPRDIGV